MLSFFNARFVFVFAFVVLLFGGCSAYWSGQHLIQVQKRIEIANLLQDVNDALCNSILNAETGQRGFLLTGDESYLDPYHRGKTEIGEELERIRALDRDADQTKFLLSIEPPIEAKMAELANTIKLRRNEGFQAALDVVRSNHGRDAMSDVRRLMSAEYVRAIDAKAALKKRSSFYVQATLTGLFLMIVALLMFWSSSRFGTKPGAVRHEAGFRRAGP